MVDICFLGINDTGEEIYRFLVDETDANVLAILTEREQLSTISRLEPDLIVSAGFRHIVPEEILDVPELGAVNCHNSYLPYNRGANANVWSIIEDAPPGVSIHYMTAALDAGPIIDRRKVPLSPDDDARDLYERLEAAQVEQFREVWPSIRDGTADTTPQDPDAGTSHRKSDFTALWELDQDAETTVGELLDRLRALSFRPYKNAYFEENGDRYYVEIDITHEADIGDVDADKGNRDEYE